MFLVCVGNNNQTVPVFFLQRLPVHIGEERVCGVLLRSLNRHRSEKTFVFIFALFDMSRCCRNIEDHAWAWASI